MCSKLKSCLRCTDKEQKISYLSVFQYLTRLRGLACIQHFFHLAKYNIFDQIIHKPSRDLFIITCNEFIITSL